MQTITRRYKVYAFKELSKEAKEKVLEKFYDINVDYDWWDYELEVIEQGWNKKYGLSFDGSKVYFDLERGSYFCFSKDGIWIEDKKKFCKFLLKEFGLKPEALSYLESLHFYFEWGSRSTSLQFEYDSECDDVVDEKIREVLLKPFEQALLDNWFSDRLAKEILEGLRKSWDYLVSEKAIIETIETNEYKFLEDGEMFKR